MSSVPYTFANSTGNIPLVYLDTNFSNVKAYANTAGTVTTATQPNITSVGTLSSLTVSGNVTATNFIGNISGNIANATYATTAGTVTTAAQPNITSVGTLSVLTTTGNIRSTSGVFVGSGTGLTNIPGANITGTVANSTHASSADTATTAGTVTTAAQPNITSVGTLSSLSVTANVTGGNIVTSGVFAGSGAELTSIPGANITGTVANATYAVSADSATTAGTVTTSAQPNITSVGALSSLTVTGNIAYSSTGLLYVDNDGFSVLSSTANSGTYVSSSDNRTVAGVTSSVGVLLVTNFGNLTTNRTLNWNYGTLDLDLNGIAPGNIANVNNITASGTITIPSVITNTITSDDSSYVTIEDGLNVVGDVDAINITVTTVKTLPVTANLLPSASATGAGTRAFVTDADSVTFGNLVVGGASNNMPVFSNGTNWYIG